MPARKTSTTTDAVETSSKVLTEDTLVVIDLSVLTGAYYVTADDEDVNLHDVWYAPEGVASLDSDQIKLLAEDVTLHAALIFLAPLVEEDLKTLPTVKSDVPKAAPAPVAKKAPAKKAAVKAPAKKAPVKRVPSTEVPVKAAKPPVKKTGAPVAKTAAPAAKRGPVRKTKVTTEA